MEEPRALKRLKQNLTTGNLWLYILSTIKSNEKAYAYGLEKQIEEEFLFKPGKVMIYLVLYKLENDKIIKSEFQERRKYYRITEKGEGVLNKAKQYLIDLGKKL